MSDQGSAADTKTINVMIADSLKLAGEAMAQVFENEDGFEVVALANSVDETVRYAGGRKPDVLVVEAPGIVGPDTVEMLVDKVAKISPGTGIVMLATANDSDTLQASLRSGIQNYTSKHEGSERLIKAASRAAEDGSYFCPSMMDVLVQSSRRRNDDLTERETSVLRLLGLGHTNSEISALLHLSVRTIEAHRSTIQEKLEVSARHELTREALDRGLVS